MREEWRWPLQISCTLYWFSMEKFNFLWILWVLSILPLFLWARSVSRFLFLARCCFQIFGSDLMFSVLAAWVVLSTVCLFFSVFILPLSRLGEHVSSAAWSGVFCGGIVFPCFCDFCSCAPALVLPGSDSVVSAVVLHPWANFSFFFSWSLSLLSAH
jgi:hypothetical protein